MIKRCACCEEPEEDCWCGFCLEPWHLEPAEESDWDWEDVDDDWEDDDAEAY